MELQLWEEIVACLPTERTLFWYYKDQFAVYLLEQQLRDGRAKIKDLKLSPQGKLLERPLIKTLLPNCGDGVLTAEQLWSLGAVNACPYVLTLGSWGQHIVYPHGQTSRPGVNLVLQLNLPNQLEKEFQAIFGRGLVDVMPFSHPYSRKRPVTLAWARMDLDFTTGELLIEEVQSDLIRILARLLERARNTRPREDGFCYWGDTRIDKYQAVRFCEQVLNDQKNLWSEAMLAASVWFAHKELGIKRIFYHTFDTGSVMKNIHRRQPPRSLYSELPERFCFVRTQRAPEFLLADYRARRRLRKSGEPEWYLLTQ